MRPSGKGGHQGSGIIGQKREACGKEERGKGGLICLNCSSPARCRAAALVRASEGGLAFCPPANPAPGVAGEGGGGGSKAPRMQPWASFRR